MSWERRLGFRSPGRVVGLIVLLSLVVAACGGDDDGLAVGDAAPGFSLEEASGGDVDLADYRGQDVLLYFHMAEG